MGNSKVKFYVDVMSATDEVTGSCTLVNVRFPNKERIRFIVDCGLYQEREHSEKNSKIFFEPKNLDFAVVTHNHVDHIGKLPYLVKKGFNKDIYTTIDTSILMPIALYDSQKILQSLSKQTGTIPLYSVENVEQCLKQVQPVEFNNPIFFDERIKITFLKNGHLIGAALIYIEISAEGEEPIRLLFTGDYAKDNMFFDVPSLPQEILNNPVSIICESTYGNMESTEISKCYEQNVLNWLKKDNAVVFSPVFSLGRSQEILYVIKKLQDSGKLDKSIPIYLDGKLARQYTNLFQDSKLDISIRDFLPENLTFVSKDIRMSLLTETKKKIILSSSGMGSYGPAQTYIQYGISNENMLIHFTGYTAEGTMGHKLKVAEENEIIQVFGALKVKKAEIEYTKEFSAHAKSDELLDFLRQFTKINMVLVNHGSIKSKEVFAKKILSDIKVKDIVILNEQFYYRISAYGLEKTLSTKFE